MNARTTAVGLRRATPWRAKCGRRRIIDDGALTGHTGPRARHRRSPVRHLTSANGSAYCKLLTSYDAKQARPRTKPSRRRVAAKAAMETAFKNLKARRGPHTLASRPRSTAEQLQVVVSRTSTSFTGRPGGRDFNFEKLSKAQIASFEASSKINGRRVKQDHGLRQERLRREGLTAFVVSFQPVVHFA